MTCTWWTHLVLRIQLELGKTGGMDCKRKGRDDQGVLIAWCCRACGAEVTSERV